VSGGWKFRVRWWMWGLLSLTWAAIAARGIATDETSHIVAGLTGSVVYSFFAGLIVPYQPEFEDGAR
jgi:hypothetical protein